MPTMDIFNHNAFSIVEMTNTAMELPYIPTFFGDLNLFEPQPIRTTGLIIESMDGTVRLIPTTERGAPLPEGQPDRRKLAYVETPRIAKADTIYAHEIQNLRSYGNYSELMVVNNEVTARQAKIKRDLEYTLEYHRMGAVQGVLLDADGTRVIRDWFAELGVTQPAEITFSFANTDPNQAPIMAKCAQVQRAVTQALGGMWVAGRSYLIGLAGDNFYDALTQNAEVRGTYLNTQQAAALRDGPAVYESFRYGGITWINFRGDDGGKIAIATDKAKFIPVGVPDLFKVAYSPAESFDYANTPGQEFYSMLIRDKDRNAWVKPEIYSYPLHYVRKPAALQRAKM